MKRRHNTSPGNPRQQESAATFDVVIVGAGINGTAAARELAAARYKVLLVEQGDFGCGASSRSSRILHCGLRYFETATPIRTFAGSPRRLQQALGMAKAAMMAREELVMLAPSRCRPCTMCFPLYDDNAIRGWHLDLGLFALKHLGSTKLPLDYRRPKARKNHLVPFQSDLRDREKLHSIAMYREYLIDWPDRLCVEAALEAERSGAEIRLFTKATLQQRDEENHWIVDLHGLDGTSQVRAPVVLNMAGSWIDEVMAAPMEKNIDARDHRLVSGTKGAHFVVRLPERYQGFGITTLNRIGMPLYCLPLRDDLYTIGPTETPFEGDARDVFASDEDIRFLLNEANHLLPGLGLKREQIEFSWAGVRPLTYDKTQPMGGRHRKIHNLASKGFSGILAMTAGPVMSHRSAGRELLGAVQKIIEIPSSENKTAAPVARDGGAPILLPNKNPDIAPLRAAVLYEHARDLSGILYTRTGRGWGEHLDEEALRPIAESVADLLDWDETEVSRQVALFLKRQSTLFRSGKSMTAA